MKIFLGGTCNNSTWRERLIPQLPADCDYYNPVVPQWTEAAYQRELRERETCDICLYTITPEMTGVYSIAEVVDDSNKRPSKTVLLILDQQNGYEFDPFVFRSLRKTADMVHTNGGMIFYSIDSFINYVSALLAPDTDRSIF